MCTMEFSTSNYKHRVLLNWSLFLWQETIVQLLNNYMIPWYTKSRYNIKVDARRGGGSRSKIVEQRALKKIGSNIFVVDKY